MWNMPTSKLMRKVRGFHTPIPTPGSTLEPGAGDGILVFMFDMLNVKGPAIEGIDRALTLNLPEENF